MLIILNLKQVLRTDLKKKEKNRLKIIQERIQKKKKQATLLDFLKLSSSFNTLWLLWNIQLYIGIQVYNQIPFKPRFSASKLGILNLSWKCFYLNKQTKLSFPAYSSCLLLA